MPQPPSYTRSEDFTERSGDDTNHTALNAELDGAAAAIGGIRTNLALIQKDDGSVANAVIGLDQLTPPVRQLFGEDNQLAVAIEEANRAEAEADRAEGEADRATTQADLATTEANRSTTKANESSASAANAAASVAAAQTLVDSVGFRDVLFKTFADSPITVNQAMSGKLLAIDTSGGPVVVNLPTIASLALPFVVGMKKTTADGNGVTINRGGTDTFDNNATSKLITGIAGTSLIADIDPSPDKWLASDWGAVSSQQQKQQFVGGVDFTAGTTTTLTLTEAPIAASKDNLDLYFDASYVQEDRYSYNPSTGLITFTAAITGGTAKVQAIWTTPVAIGVPSVGSVGTNQVADGAVTAAKLAASSVTTDKILNDNVTTSKIADDSVISSKIAASAVTSAKIADASVTQAKLSQPSTLAAAQNTTSGTSIDFTGIPAWVKRITLMLNGVSTNGTSNVIVRLGAGSVQTSGYNSGAAYGPAPGTQTNTDTTSFLVDSNGNTSAATIRYGQMIFTNMGGNLWACSGVVACPTPTTVMSVGGIVALSGTLDRLRITTGVGADTFDAGSVNILYE